MNENKITLPIAIVIAGALIAGAILITRVGSGPVVANGEKPKLGIELYTKLAKDLKIKEKAFNDCLLLDEVNQKVTDQFNEAVAIGGRGTPYTIIIAPNGTRAVISGALPYETVKASIDKAIAGTLEAGQAELSKMLAVSDTDHAIGGSGEITLVEYSDFQCPFCARFDHTVKRALLEYPTLKLVYRHFPLSNLHPEAKPAAIASECVARLAGNDAFWKFADSLFASQ